MESTAILTNVLLTLFGFAGGGGSSSGGGGGGGSSSHSSSSGGDGDGDPIVLIITLIIVAGVWGLVYISNKRARAKKAMTNNSTPQEKFIHQEAKSIFRKYQDDWSNFNTKSIAKYTTNKYCEHATLMLELLKNLHRVNKVSNLGVSGVFLLSPVNDQTALPAEVRVEFEFSGLDQVIDTKTNETLYSNSAKKITETWTFLYDGKKLKLSGISQPTESANHLVKSLADFAGNNNLFYSPDWGRYALPSRGLIFGNAKMQISDINNHIVGKWGDLLIQMYTYAEAPANPNFYYLVGQISLPKEYKGVIVKSRHSRSKVFRRISKDYDKFELEWNDFNDRYEVYAASADALPAFELLNPKFMELLYSKNPDYSLEVADNTIYIFLNIKQATEQDYSDLLAILTAAYQELKQ